MQAGYHAKRALLDARRIGRDPIDGRAAPDGLIERFTGRVDPRRWLV